MKNVPWLDFGIEAHRRPINFRRGLVIAAIVGAIGGIAVGVARLYI